MEENNTELESLRQAHTADPSDRDVATKLAQMYTDLGWFNEAGDIYKELLKLHNDDYSILLDYGNLCFRQRNHDEAQTVFQKLTLLKPTRLEGWNNLGIVQLTTGNFESARTSFAKVLQLEPDNCGALLNMGNYHDSRKETDEAISFFERAVEAQRDFVDGWFNLGNAYVTAKNYAKAVEAYTRALRINAEFPSALKNLGYAHEQLHEFDEAQQCYSKALELNRTDASLYVNLASIYAKQRKYDKAKDYFLRAVKLSPREPAGWMGLRHLSLLKGDIPTYVKSTLAILHRLDAAEVAATLRKLRELQYWDGSDAVVKLADRLGIHGDELDAERLLTYSRTDKDNPSLRVLSKRLASVADPSDTVRLCLAEYEYRNGRYDKAVGFLECVATSDLAGYKLVWMSLIALKKWDKAQELIESYLADHRDCFDAWYLLARTKCAKGNAAEAKKDLVRALENGFTDLEALEQDPELKRIYQDLSIGL